ncbi:hypothetical protein [Halalkalicoccus subterraneus]|uniref:hypothetical protein n=1 Tax=Halalkalicoccus subterraneus TaxID=2675002 RepID=UPI000EFCE859|nr:hypothetical protein [Halalkalicoccus subterraneus]
MASDKTKTIAGVILLVVSGALLFASGMDNLSIPIALAALATTGLAIGSLLVGTTGEGPAV